MSGRPLSRVSRVCPASCPAFNSFALNTVPRVTRLILLKDATAPKRAYAVKVRWGYLGKHAGQRGTRDKIVVPNTHKYYGMAAADWIERNQLGRRNLKPDQLALLRGRIYNRAKKASGVRTDLTSGKSYPRSRTSEAVAKETGVSEKTVRNDAAFASAVDAVSDIAPDLKKQVISGAAPARKEVIAAAKLAETQPELAKEVLAAAS